MKYITLSLMLIISIYAKAQHPVINNDTAMYNGYHYTIGDTAHISYGSGNNKDFVFVMMGSGLTGWSPLDSKFSKSDILINKVYKSMGKVYLRGVILNNATVNALGGNKIFIEMEGAVDNGELK